MLALIVRPATTARIVAKATALIKAKKTLPPSASARSGALMFSILILPGVRIVAEPNQRNVDII